MNILITGASRGIGAAAYALLKASGHRVVGHSTKGSDELIAGDLSDPAAPRAIWETALAELDGRIDVLVNNAGIAGPTGKVDEIAPEDWDRCLAIDITGQFNCTRLAVPHLRKSKNASIVNLSSAAGRLGFPLRTPYAAAKWGVVGFTKSLAAELGPDGIRVNAIQPGIVKGERIDRVMENKARARGISVEAMTAEALSVVSMRTMVTPRQIADQVVFLCSERGRTISGQAISICGDTQMLP
jgi:NAD(P)-dependent dehydrogenase (short-subunit alcohol dehydrogenase family)